MKSKPCLKRYQLPTSLTLQIFSSSSHSYISTYPDTLESQEPSAYQYSNSKIAIPITFLNSKLPSGMDFLNSEKTQKSPLGKLYRKLSPKRAKEGKSSSLPPSPSRVTSSSEINESELRAVFDYMDENSDGKISVAELQKSVSLLGGALLAHEAEAVVNMSDLDGDGCLAFEEFLNLMEGKECTEEDKRRELKEAFGMYTMEGSECITAASLRRMLSRLGESRTVDDCKAMIRAFDLNGDGVLGFDEFALMMR